MQKMTAIVPSLITVVLFFISSVLGSSNSLSVDYYKDTCPEAEALITEVVHNATVKDITIPAALLRMHFHDCFIRGCDASVLLNSTRKEKAEKEGDLNLSLRAFYVYDDVKTVLEKKCPGVVSCADILAVAARDAVAISGGPTWDVPKGRKDGRISKADEVAHLPLPTFNISQMEQSFSEKGLTLEDAVALLGGHSLGGAACSNFQHRLYNFNGTYDVDPSLDPSFAASLRQTCMKSNGRTSFDTTPAVFSNTFYQRMVQGMTLFSSDAALLSSSKTAALVHKFAASQNEFFEAFSKSMIKMSSISGGGTEIRLNCRFVN